MAGMGKDLVQQNLGEMRKLSKTTVFEKLQMGEWRLLERIWDEYGGVKEEEGLATHTDNQQGTLELLGAIGGNWKGLGTAGDGWGGSGTIGKNERATKDGKK